MKLKKLIENLDTPKKTTNEKAAFIQEVKKFNEYGSVIYRTEDLRRVAEEINELVTKAEAVTLQTVKEISKLQQRLESLYEEMGHNLSRYYEL